MANRRIVTLRELGAVLQVSPSTLSRWATAGVIPCIRGPRTVRFDLDRVLASLDRGRRDDISTQRGGQ